MGATATWDTLTGLATTVTGIPATTATTATSTTVTGDTTVTARPSTVTRTRPTTATTARGLPRRRLTPATAITGTGIRTATGIPTAIMGMATHMVEDTTATTMVNLCSPRQPTKSKKKGIAVIHSISRGIKVMNS